MQKSSLIEEVYKYIDQKDFQHAITLIKKKLDEKDANFIEDLIIGLNIITENALEVVKEILPSLLSILNHSDDVIRYSMIVSLKKFMEVNAKLIFPYSEEYLKSPSAKNREGMLLLLKYVAETNPSAIESLFDIIITKLSDKEDFVRKKVIEVLATAGKKLRGQLEAKIFNYIKTETNPVAKDAADQALKGMIDLAALAQQELDRMQLEAQEKAIVEKKKQLEQTNSDLKRIELEIQERDLQSKIEKENLEKSLKEWQQKIEESDLKIKVEKLQLEVEQKTLNLKKLVDERGKLARNRELIEKQIELDKVKHELDQKKLEEDKAKLISEEALRIEKKLKELSKHEDKDSDYEEI